MDNIETLNKNHAFILASDKVELFINQDNKQFKNAMARLEKVKKSNKKYKQTFQS